MMQIFPLKSESITPPPKKTGLSERPERGKSFAMYFFGNFKPKSVSIFLVTPGSRVTLLDENTSNHAEPDVAFIGT